jgi:hypothetical protein
LGCVIISGEQGTYEQGSYHHPSRGVVGIVRQ